MTYLLLKTITITEASSVYILRFHVSYYDISLLYNRIHLKWISLCYCANWRLSYLRVDLTLKTTPPPKFLGLPIRIHHTFVLFKDVTLTLIIYLETWLRSDNTSCYYTCNWPCVCRWKMGSPWCWGQSPRSTSRARLESWDPSSQALCRVTWHPGKQQKPFEVSLQRKKAPIKKDPLYETL
jgi:hypothetical protein